MNKSLLWKVLIPIVLLLGLLFGLLQRRPEAPTRSQTTQALPQKELQNELQSFYQKSSTLKMDKPSMTQVTFLAVGDIMLSRNVAAKIDETKDPLYPFSNMTDTLNATDFNFGNLESPFSKSNTYSTAKTLVFNVPNKNKEGLKQYHFTMLNLANNHALDQGTAGVTETLKTLAEIGTQGVGVGTTLKEAWQPKYQTVHGITIAFIGASYASTNDGGKSTNELVARIEDIEKLKQAIITAQTHADFVVVTMHAGTEYTRLPNAAQIAFAHASIDAGADMVIGAHPHWIQQLETYKNKPIFYSLGNFIFDQNWSKETSQGLTLKISLEKNKSMQDATPILGTPGEELQGSKTIARLTRIELIPVIIENNSRPRPATIEERTKILTSIDQKDSVITY